MNNTKLIISQNLERLMADRNWTQLDLSRRAGIGQTTISHIVRDGATTAQTLGHIARAFRLESWVLLVPDLPSQAFGKALMQLVRGFSKESDDSVATTPVDRWLIQFLEDDCRTMAEKAAESRNYIEAGRLQSWSDAYQHLLSMSAGGADAPDGGGALLK